MTDAIPTAIAAYYAGSNAKDADAAVAAFAETGTVVDEGQIYVGRQAIHDWLLSVFAKYGVTSTVTEVAATGNVYRIAALVAGDFPGSPATLHYDFTIDDEHIARLSIG